MNNEISWKKYIDTTADKPPRALLVSAMQYVTSKTEALDIGAGALMDSKFLLEQGFTKVTALDADDAAAEKASTIQSPHFSFSQAYIETFVLAPHTYDIINAQRVLPYIAPRDFYAVVTNIK